MDQKKTKLALVLTGGGARAAYQVGVLRAIVELLPKNAKNPFPVLVGTSAGAINSAAIAIYGSSLHDAVARLYRIWHNFHVHQVFRSDVQKISFSAAHWIFSFILGGLGKRNPTSFLDRAPLLRLLNKYLPCEVIEKNLEQGVLESLCISASSYDTGRSTVFYHSRSGIEPWQRSRREGRPGKISVDHLMASSAIPLLFSPVKVGDGYYGDGSMRDTAPISPAIHMGADKILIVDVSSEPDPRGPDEIEFPSLAQVGGHILNSIFIDGLESDLERLQRINKTIQLIPSHHLVEHNVSLRPINTLVISPSRDLQQISLKHFSTLPKVLQFLLKGVGALDHNGSSLISYILFEKSFCREVIALGYADAMARKEELKGFISEDSGL